MTDAAVSISIGAKIDELINEFKQASESVQQSAQQIAQSVGTSMNRVEQSTNEATDALRRTEREAADAGRGIMGSLGGVTSFLQGMLGGILAGFSLDAGIRAVLDFADTAEALSNTAQVVDMTATAISRLHASATPMGFTAAAVDKGLIKLARTMSDAARGGEEQAAAFDAIGIKASELKNMSIEQVLAKISDKFMASEDGATKTALAMALLGKSGAELVPWLNQGSEAMKEAGDAAERMGAVMSEDAVAAGNALDGAMDNLGLAAGGLKKEFAKGLAPAVQFIAETFTDSSGAAADFGVVFKAISSIVVGVTVIVRQAWAVISGIVRSITVYIAALSDAMYKTLTLDFTGAKAALTTGTSMIKDSLGEMVDDYQTAGAKASAAMQAIWNGPQGAAAPEGPDAPKGQIDFKEAETGGGGKDAAADKARAAQQAAEREAFELKMEQLRSEMSEHQRSAVERIGVAQQMTEAVKAQFGEVSKEYERAKREELRITEEVAAEKRRIEDGALTLAQQHAQHAIQLEKGKSDYLLATGQITAAQKLQVELNAQEQTYAMQMSYLQKRLELYATEPQMIDQINEQILKLQQERALQMQQADVAQFEVNKQQWDTYFQSISDGFANAIQGMVFQGTTLEQAMGTILQNIIGQVIQTGVKMLANWTATQLGMTGATVTGAATRSAAEVASAKTSVVANAGAAIKNIITKGAEVFANVYNAIAGIPYVGPFLAPVMAVAATGAVVGYVGKVASAEGGWDRVPYDGAKAILHKEEMVLPAPLAEGIRGMVESGNTQRGGGITIHALDRRDVARYFDDNSDVMVRALMQHGNNNPGGF